MYKIRYPAKIYKDPEDPTWWVTEFPGLGGPSGCIMTCAESWDKIYRMTSECLSAYVLSKLEQGEPLEDPQVCIPEQGKWEWISLKPK